MALAQVILAATTVAAPVPKENQSPYWAGPDYWDRRHAAKLAEIAAGPKEYDFVFIGDSITHNWEGWSDPKDVAVVTKAHADGKLKFPNGPGRKVWEEMKREFRLLNLGCGGDTTQNVLWRLDHGELDGYRTKGVALMIGTNNRESAKAVAEGIKAVVRKILEKQPQAKVILMPIFPCGETQTSDNRMRNADVEWCVRPVADGERVIWLDFNRDFLEPDGTLSPAMMPDYLHPLEPGYRLWRSAIEPVMRRIAHFGAARPVWPADRADRMNDNVRFRGAFDAPAEGTTCALELACSTTYRARLNGEFLSYGPARGPKGKFRIDRIELDGRLKPGRNVLEIEVHGANVNSYEFMDQPSFLQAEVTAGGKVLLATKAGEDGFAAFDWHERVRKVSRFSFQRLWGEAYRVGDGANPPRLTLEERPAVDLLPRDAPLPLCPVSDLRPVATLHRRHDAGKPVELPRYLFLVGHEGFKGYRTGELEVNVTEETLRYSVDGQGPIASTLWKSDDLLAGFVGAEVVCRKPGRFVLFFSEIGSPETGAPPFRNGNDATGAVFWDIRSPGTYVLEGFNPTGARFVETFMHGGEAEVKRVWVREYKSARPFARPFAGTDPDLAKIYSAAANSLSQNAVDVFTDCPGRERAAWIGDTFFTARASAFLTGSTDVERTFLGNYAYADAYEDIPAGEFPMVYPGDHTNGNFIPNFSMWLVLQLSEYARRGGDLQLVMKMRPKVMALLRHLDGCRSGEGLLENLPGWVFVCWSHANALVKGVNYPSNLQYAGVLDAVAELYGMPELSERAKRIRETVRRKSWNGRWFRDCDWCEDTTECCQYYAFFFGAADRARDAGLWERLVRTCGPNRDAKSVHPELHKSNSIFGYYLRFTLLRDFGERDVLTKELKDYFLPMAKETGTLWEHSGPSGSLAHGLSSYAAVLADFAASPVAFNGQGDCRLPANARVVQDARGYNSWPMIQAFGRKLVCSYSRDSACPSDGHTIHEGTRDVYAKVSRDGGMTWSSETTVAADPTVGEVNEGIGLDATGAVLAWVRCWGDPAKRRHELYRSTDGVSFEKIAALKPDPFPMQVTDPVSVPGLGLVSPWFAGDYDEGPNHSWGLLVSADGGRTWEQRTVESGLSLGEWVTEPSLASLGNGRLLVVGRCEQGLGNQFQVTSTDGGRTWRKARTNIGDVRESTPSLVYDPKSDALANYYYHRGARLLKRRVAKADYVFGHPDRWPEPEILAEGFEPRIFDAGNVNVTRLGDGTDCCAWYTGTSSNASVVVTAVARP